MLHEVGNVCRSLRKEEMRQRHAEHDDLADGVGAFVRRLSDGGAVVAARGRLPKFWMSASEPRQEPRLGAAEGGLDGPKVLFAEFLGIYCVQLCRATCVWSWSARLAAALCA